MKYADRINTGDKAAKKAQQQEQVEENQENLELDLATTKKAIRKEKRELNSLKSAANLSLDAIIAKTNRIESLEKGLKITEDLLEELF